MKLFVVLALVSVALGGMDYEMTQKWQKLKAMESCWGEDNMKIYTVNMKKAVAKCQQKDVPELDLPPLRAINRMINNMVGMAGHREDQHQEMEYFQKFFRFMQMMKMMNHDDHDDYDDYNRKSVYVPTFKSDEVYRPKPYSQMKDSSDMNMMEKMKMMMMMKKMMDNKNHHEDYYKDYDRAGDEVQGTYKRHDDMSSMYKKMGYQNKMDNYMKSRNDDFSMDSMFRSMGQMVRFDSYHQIYLI